MQQHMDAMIHATGSANNHRASCHLVSYIYVIIIVVYASNIVALYVLPVTLNTDLDGYRVSSPLADEQSRWVTGLQHRTAVTL
jgi:hypothetical protein